MGDHRENNVQIWTKVGFVLKIDGMSFCLADSVKFELLSSELAIFAVYVFALYLLPSGP